MGEMAEAMLDGECCQTCGEFFMDDETPGYPRSCSGCGGSSGPGQGRAAARRRRKQRQNARKAQAKRDRLAKADPTGWVQHTPHHWQRQHEGKTLDFWPSTGKFMFDGAVHIGDINAFMKGAEK